MPQCPHCRSHQVIARNYAKKIGRTLGSATGIAAGVTATLRGAYFGSKLVAFAGPPGRVLGGMTGAILNTLIWGVMAGKAGANLGQVVDDHILDNYQCLRCGALFSASNDPVVIEGLFSRSPDWPGDSGFPDYPVPPDEQ